MAFEAKQLDATLINNNTEYQEGDALQPSAINDMVEGILHNQGNSGGSGLTEEEKAKLDKIVIDGDGTKYLSNDGTYKGVESGSNVTVDRELSLNSENPVQNKVVTGALDGKLRKPTADDMPIGSTMHLLGVARGNLDRETWCAANPNYIYSAGTLVNGKTVPIIPVYKVAGKPFASMSEEALANTPNTIFVATPQLPWEAANKKYVDDNKGTKLYRHTITIPYSENSEMPTYEKSIVIKFFSLSKSLITDTTIMAFRVDVNELQLDDYKNSYIISSPLVGANSLVSGDTAKQMTVKYAEDGASKGFWYYLAWSELGLDIKSIDTANIVEVIEDL